MVNFIITMYYKKCTFNAKSVDSDQTSRSAASDLGLHFLPVQLLSDARHKTG